MVPGQVANRWSFSRSPTCRSVQTCQDPEPRIQSAGGSPESVRAAMQQHTLSSAVLREGKKYVFIHYPDDNSCNEIEKEEPHMDVPHSPASTSTRQGSDRP